MNVVKSNKKLLLIEPPFSRLFKDTYSLDRFPLALGYLSGTVKRETDWDVMAYNADFNHKSEMAKLTYFAGPGYENYIEAIKGGSAKVWDEARSTIQEYQPGVVGISAKSQNYASACIIARIVKQIDNDIIVVVGGPHPSMVGQQVFDCPDIDISVRGEGERTIVELLHAIGSQTELAGIDGLVYKKGDDIIENTPRQLIDDLDTLCFPYDYASEVLKDYDKYPLTAFRSIFSIRGCPYNCFFCGSRNIWTRKVRLRSVGNVVAEIRKLQAIGVRAIHFDDDTFGVTKKHIYELCNAIKQNCPDVKWSCEIHVKLVDDETIALMKDAGCYYMIIGIESGNNDILKQMRKNITISDAFKACQIIKKHKIELGTFFMVGFPQETESTLNDTLSAIKKIKCDSLIYNIFTPYPGTETFDYCKEHGLIGEDYDVSLYNHHSPANCFCENISSERFRELVSKIEKTVDRKQVLGRIKKIFSVNTFWKIKELGFVGTLKKACKVLTGR